MDASSMVKKTALLVIGIIVILSGATAIGVISWVNNAKNTAANLEANNGDHFEQEALESVKKIAGTAGSHVIKKSTTSNLFYF